MNSLHSPDVLSFASDNYAGAHPQILAAVAAANGGHVAAYGYDIYTEKLQQLMRSHLGEQAQCWPVFNGTGANVLGLQAMMPRWGAVICANSAHLNTDENGAPQITGGLKLWLVDAPHGKLTPELIARQAWGFGSEHRAQPLGGEHQPNHRMRHMLHRRRNPRHCRLCPQLGHEAAHGWCPHRQCGCLFGYRFAQHQAAMPVWICFRSAAPKMVCCLANVWWLYRRMRWPVWHICAKSICNWLPKCG